MKQFGVILVWTMAVLLFVAVAFTAVSDRFALTPLTVELLTTTTQEIALLTVNLNTATTEELQQLEGIGKVLAARIIAYREAHGGFRTIDDLKDVEGIGETRLEKWRPHLTV